MKVITEGKKIEWWAGKSGECSHCGTVVEAEAIDKPNVTHDQRDGTMASLRCPRCGQNIWFYPRCPTSQNERPGFSPSVRCERWG